MKLWTVAAPIASVLIVAGIALEAQRAGAPTAQEPGAAGRGGGQPAPAGRGTAAQPNQLGQPLLRRLQSRMRHPARRLPPPAPITETKPPAVPAPAVARRRTDSST